MTTIDLNKLAGELDGIFNQETHPKTGFFLLVFPADGEGTCEFITNSPRAQVMNLLTTQLAVLKRAEALGEAPVPIVPERKNGIAS